MDLDFKKLDAKKCINDITKPFHSYTKPFFDDCNKVIKDCLINLNVYDKLHKHKNKNNVKENFNNINNFNEFYTDLKNINNNIDETNLKPINNFYLLIAFLILIFLIYLLIDYFNNKNKN